MDRKICLCLSLAVGVSLATGCSRQSTPQAGAQKSKASYPLNPPQAGRIESSAPQPFRPVDPSMQVAERPSPFHDPPSAEPPPKAPAPVRNRIGNADRSVHGVKAFTLPPPLISKLARHEVDAALPLSPAIDAPVFRLGGSPAFTETVGDSATATCEVSKPKGIHRIIHKLAGIRKGAAVTGGQDFVPPRPVHEIRFVLPSGAIPILAQGKKMDLKANVDASGRVTRVELLSPRDEELATLVGYAASRWSFSPAQLDEQAVPSEVVLHFDFHGGPVPSKHD